MQRGGLLFFILSSLALSFTCKSQDVEINLNNPTKPVITVKISANSFSKPAGDISSEEGKKILAVFMVKDNKAAAINLIGNYHIDNTVLRFTPQHNLGYGLEFEVQHYKDKDTLRKRFIIPPSAEPEVPLAEVIKFFPAADKIPANILTFYISFSQSMADDISAHQYIRILNSKGEEKPLAWRQRSYWLNDNKILVMMIHPGRVKRGIDYKPELGEIFTVGMEYSLVVTTMIKDRFQRPLSKEYSKKFTVIDKDREIPAINFSSLSSPLANTLDPLQITFSEGMDYGSVTQRMKIFNVADSALVEGEFVFTDHDSVWKFIPKQSWKKKTEYEILFDKKISDFAGNCLHRLFEITDLNQLNEENIPIKWSFTPK